MDHPKATPSGLGQEILWKDGTRSWFHNFWLRENCNCRKCTHPQAWERTLNFLSVPHDISPETLRADDAGLHMTWPRHDADCDNTFYSWDWLWENRTDTPARLSRKKTRTSWRARDLDINNHAIDYDMVMGSDAGLREFLEHIDDVGVAMIRNVPDTHEALLDLAAHIAFIEESHFGRCFEVESKPDPENLAYTSHSLPLHNDLPSRSQLPGVQFLHCRTNDAAGGESIMVDSLSVAARMKSEHPDYYAFLTRTPVKFTSIDEDWHIINRAPVIALDEDGDVIGTRMHPALLGPVDVPPEDMDMFYRAHRKMMEMCADPEMQLVFRLSAGDCQVFDNYRIMHARKSFDPNTGRRHLHGCYITSDDMRSRLDVLRRQGADFRQT